MKLRFVLDPEEDEAGVYPWCIENHWMGVAYLLNYITCCIYNNAHPTRETRRLIDFEKP